MIDPSRLACVFPRCAEFEGVDVPDGRFCARCGRPLGGSRLGPAATYQIEGYLGSGYYADVFRALHLVSGVPFAVKIYDGDPRKRRAAARELAALRSLAHPRLPELRESFGDGGWLFVVMELVGGRSLREEVERHGPLPAASAMTMAIEVCEVFEYVASRQWTYRDLHPKNIHLDTSKGTMVVDLDGARPPDWPSQPSGRIGYRAPELERSETVTPACDVYSLVGCLYFALTGDDPPLEPGPLSGLQGRLACLQRSARLLDECRRADPSTRPEASYLRAALESSRSAGE